MANSSPGLQPEKDPKDDPSLDWSRRLSEYLRSPAGIVNLIVCGAVIVLALFPQEYLPGLLQRAGKELMLVLAVGALLAWNGVRWLVIDLQQQRKALLSIPAQGKSLGVIQAQLSDMAETDEKRHAAAAFRKLLGMKNGDECLLVHSCDRGHSNDGDGVKSYLTAPVKLDEAPSVMRVWHFLTSALGTSEDVTVSCSCEVYRQLQSARQKATSVESAQQSGKCECKKRAKHCVIFGSPKLNELSESLFQKCRIHATDEQGTPYFDQHFNHHEDGTKYEYWTIVCDQVTEHRPDPTNLDAYKHFPPGEGPPDSVKLYDHALFARLPGELLPQLGSTPGAIIVLAGCKTAGQVALAEWLSHASNFADYRTKYGDYFYVVFKVHYKYRNQYLPLVKGTPSIASSGGITYKATMSASVSSGS